MADRKESQLPLEQLRQIRIDKLNNLRELGINPYPSKSNRTHLSGEVINSYKNFEGKKVTVDGRLVSIRFHGAIAFADLKDESGQIQLYIKKNVLKATDPKDQIIGFDHLSLLDIGDFVEVKGVITKTKTGEVSIQPESIRILVKTLRPLPQKSGLHDKETRLRKRYIDTNVNEAVYQRFIRRSKFWKAHREFFDKYGFLEMNIPVLEHTPGGADANPFVTHMDAIDQDFYLRISQELYLKRLVGGGYPKVYEIGPRFRNEGLSDEHLPEHIAMEFYWAYASWGEGMEFVKKLYDYVLKEVYEGKKKFEIRGFDVDFSKGWEIIDFAEVMAKEYSFDVYDTSVEEVDKLLKERKIIGDFARNLHRGVDMLWKNIRKSIGGPAFLINHPKYLSPLAKSKPDDLNVTERFQPIIAGSELGNGWSEINDPLDQLERFKEQQALRDAGDKEAQWLDIDYIEMLEYGMPPTFGYGHSERVFWFLEDVSAREGVPFPQLKHELDESAKKIYNLK